MLTSVADGVLVHRSELLQNNTVVVHGSVGRGDQVIARVGLDRAYVHALRDGRAPDDDPRIGPSVRPGWEWVNDIHTGQLQSLGREVSGDGLLADLRCRVTRYPRRVILIGDDHGLRTGRAA